MKTALWVLTLVLIIVMPTQLGVLVGAKGQTITRTQTVTLADGRTATETVQQVKMEGGVRVTPGDALLVAVFLLWAVYVVATLRFFEVRFPFLACFALAALMAAAALHSSALDSSARGPGLREAAQVAAYFLGGWFVFANCIGSRGRLRAAVGVFSLVVSAMVVLALVQYYGSFRGNVFDVSGTFGNRNVLGMFFAVTLPFVFALALYEERPWQKYALMLTVAIGAMVTLSGGALLAVAAGVTFVAAARSRLALAGAVLAVAVALTVMPHVLPLPRHTDVLVSSVSPYVRGNYLDRRSGEPAELDDPVVAVRYRVWYAGLKEARREMVWPFLGAGPGRFNQAIEQEYGTVEKPSGATDVVKDFNIATSEPDTFSTYLVTAVGAGPLALAALVWVLGLFLGTNLREHARSRDSFGRALALGAAGAVVGAAVCSMFSDLLVRGVALPFLFVALSGILWPRLPDSAD